ncbi:predicted protein [Lichtheimia corymbifera JMRC:FSU:9682]|uniref:Uncharacterized protein n=1 Tax=Lichtheimia corymbifera JMRC:FSU:9682 TaxID=1263082 RepID=A0A068S5L3_9FUNG|nr:predicted protein [Lichtheimia corymbifera JMRC:FSU:9682]
MTVLTHHKRQPSIYDSLPMLDAWNKGAALPDLSFSTDPPCVHQLQQEHTDIPGSSPRMQRKHIKSIMMHLINKNGHR